MTRNHSKISALFCAAALGLSLSACSSAPEAKPEASKSPNRISTPYQAQKPSAEQLANRPCGNPDWAQLPPGTPEKSQPDAPPADAPAPGEEPSSAPGDETSSAKPRTSGAHARAVSSLSAIKPCS